MSDKRLDEYLRKQDQAELDEEVAEILTSGRVGPMRVVSATRNVKGGWSLYLDPTNPKWTCTVCGGTKLNVYWSRVGNREVPCYFCKGKGFVTDPRKVSKMPSLVQFKPRGES